MRSQVASLVAPCAALAPRAALARRQTEGGAQREGGCSCPLSARLADCQSQR